MFSRGSFKLIGDKSIKLLNSHQASWVAHLCYMPSIFFFFSIPSIFLINLLALFQHCCLSLIWIPFHEPTRAEMGRQPPLTGVVGSPVIKRVMEGKCITFSKLSRKFLLYCICIVLDCIEACWLKATEIQGHL